MSRIGKKPILIPEGVEVEIKDKIVSVKGSKGELAETMPDELFAEKKNNKILIKVKKQDKHTPALWGLFRALLQNKIIGVSQGFEKELEIQGIGYRAGLKDDKILTLEAGFTHPIELVIPDGLKINIEKNIIKISGIDKYKVGQFAANIRRIRPPEPYKGKGIRYLGEKVRRKEGKKAGATTA